MDTLNCHEVVTGRLAKIEVGYSGCQSHKNQLGYRTQSKVREKRNLGSDRTVHRGSMNLATIVGILCSLNNEVYITNM